jgi:DNA-binding NarL/FixJ family response regulator
MRARNGHEERRPRSSSHQRHFLRSRPLREREIAGLIAAGLSNSEIADRLVLSVRTVESHIYRACAKLDVTDRD